jgi:Ca2+-binding EF-hand superfamily protein
MVFKKFDASRKGHLNQIELKKLLAHCQLNTNPEEMVMSLSEFDPDLKGIFTYELVFKYLIDKALMSNE